jgi:hypothetical protein
MLVAIRNMWAISVAALMLAVGLPIVGVGNSPVLAAASTVPSCRGNVFLGAWVGRNGAGGSSIFQVAFINDGTTTCRLAGYPIIQGYRDGREYPLKTEHIKSNPFGLSPTIVAPRMSGEMVITTSALCNALNTGNQSSIKKVIARTTYTVSVKFPHSNYPIDVNGLSLTVACGLDVTQLGWH